MRLVFSRCLIVFIIVWLGGCQSLPQRSSFESSVACAVAHAAPKPAWVISQVNRQGYYVGVGAAPVSQAYGADLERATQRARADLAASIKTSIHRIIRSNARVYEDKGLSFSREDRLVIIQATTEMSLENVRRIATWRDSDSCQLWVQVQVDEATVNAYLTRHQNKQILHRAEALFNLAADKSQTLEARIHRLAMALSLLQEVDFDILTMQKLEFYQPRYERRVFELKAQLSQRQTVVLVSASSPLANRFRNQIANPIASMVQGSAYQQQQNCLSVPACLMMARQARATQLVLVKLDATVQRGSMGSDIGEMAVVVELYDAVSGQRLTQSGQVKADVFSFENNIDWSLLIQRVTAQASIKQALWPLKP